MSTLQHPRYRRPERTARAFATSPPTRASFYCLSWWRLYLPVQLLQWPSSKRSVRFATSPGPQVDSESCSYREGCTDSREQTLRFPPHRDRAGCCTATVLERALVLQP